MHDNKALSLLIICTTTETQTKQQYFTIIHQE